ncbi:hypothetical protein L9F63_001892, partial [Diploptera punctata]
SLQSYTALNNTLRNVSRQRKTRDSPLSHISKSIPAIQMATQEERFRLIHDDFTYKIVSAKSGFTVFTCGRLLRENLLISGGRYQKLIFTSVRRKSVLKHVLITLSSFLLLCNKLFCIP